MDSIAQQYATSMIDIVTPVFERSILIACEYCKATGRETLTPEDVEYATKYCAMNVVGNHIGSFFPEVYDEEDDEDSLEEVCDDDCPPFIRYSGDEQKFLKVNEAHDRWNEWIPQSPVEEMLKNAINSNGSSGMDEQ